jgi:transcriptional regulator with XRE-family HTH domain
MNPLKRQKRNGLPGLRSAREAKNLDRYQLADLVGVRYVTIHKLETAGSNCSQDLLTDLAEKLGVTTDHLIGLPGESQVAS